MKTTKIIYFGVAAIASMLFSGCSSDIDTAHQKTTVLGIFSFEPESYAPTSPTNLAVRTDELFGMELPSGNRTKLLWGFITLEDY